MGKPAQSRLLLSVFFLVWWVQLFSAASALESPQPIGYFCGSDTASIAPGQFYIPQGGCVYLSPTLTGSRYGDIYRGTVGSSTIVNGHSLGFNATSTTQFGDSIPDPQQGEDLFVAIFPAQFLNEFRTYFQTGAGTPIGNNYGFLPFKYGTPPPPEPEAPDPVIIIPGILGSEEHNGEWVIDPILHTYDDLLATLDANHYTPDVDLFTFPYNWRKSNVETAVLLKQKIDAVKTICQCEKVDLVAHSMGGLVARQYIQSDAYEQDVDQLIFLGTPHLGAPKAYLMWEGGTVGAPPLSIEDSIFIKMLEHEGYEKRYPTLFDYLRTEPIESVRQLLPVESYLYDGDILRPYPLEYPQNIFLETLNANVNKLYDSGVEIHSFVGDTTAVDTISAFRVVESDAHIPKWENGYPEGFYENSGFPGVIRNIGDETVPLWSSAFVDSNVSVTPFEHSALPEQNEGEIFQILNGKVAGILVHDHNITNYKLILIKILSPADLLVIAPDGKKVGKQNGQEVREIPDAFYTGFNTDTEFITILNPLDGEYKIYTEGTDTGTYAIETNYMSGATTTQATYMGNTAPGLVTELTLNVDNTNPQNLEITPSDTTPPIITIVSPGAKDYLRSEQMLVDVTASDDESGVQKLETHLDNEIIPNTATIDLFYRTLGAHQISASSTDMAGNATSTSHILRIVANATSTFSDIERTYFLGWMTQKVKDNLTKKLKSCSVKRTVVTTVTKTVVVTGKNGKPTTKKIQEKVTKVEIVFDKNCARAMLKDLDKYRNKGLNDAGYRVLKEDIEWLIS